MFNRSESEEVENSIDSYSRVYSRGEGYSSEVSESENHSPVDHDVVTVQIEEDEQDQISHIEELKQKFKSVASMKKETTDIMTEAKATRRDANLRMDLHVNEGFDFSPKTDDLALYQIDNEKANDSDDEDSVYPLSIRYDRKKDVERKTVSYF